MVTAETGAADGAEDRGLSVVGSRCGGGDGCGPNQVESVAVRPDGKTVAIGLNMAVGPDAEDAVLLWQPP